jgi:hypothetical protein
MKTGDKTRLPTREQAGAPRKNLMGWGGRAPRLRGRFSCRWPDRLAMTSTARRASTHIVAWLSRGLQHGVCNALAIRLAAGAGACV